VFWVSKHVETFLLIGLGGIIGANLRYWVSGWAADRFGQAFPWGTLLINISGSCLLAVFIGWSANHIALDPRVRLFVSIGFFGAFTTFSTYANESVALMRAGDWIGMVGNTLGTNLVCILGALIGLAVGRQL
jgi:CrcB protein